MSIQTGARHEYMRCTKRLDNKACPGCGKIYTHELEEMVASAMNAYLERYQARRMQSRDPYQNPEIAVLNSRLKRVETDIEKLLDALTGANAVLFSYVNARIIRLDEEKKETERSIAKLNEDSICPSRLDEIAAAFTHWEPVAFEEKRKILNEMVEVIHATSEAVDIKWKL